VLETGYTSLWGEVRENEVGWMKREGIAKKEGEEENETKVSKTQ